MNNYLFEVNVNNNVRFQFEYELNAFEFYMALKPYARLIELIYLVDGEVLAWKDEE